MTSKEEIDATISAVHIQALQRDNRQTNHRLYLLHLINISHTINLFTSRMLAIWKLALFVAVGCTKCVTADAGDDFSNNLFTDLAPQVSRYTALVYGFIC